ncbi:hypothetical protein [Burkholderia pseudomallei]|uniref:hypothetical protein n=1 Tax=Burkholderia pseudomallei TaxID=28450 RepID=UPI000A1A1428|nr:hypothetical protein [Burkholderia pseudomallei]ARL90983.1 hypothetical protein BOC57_34950 [Burkholderia pseudomallei]
MSLAAQDLLELMRLAKGGAGALTEHLLREIALNLIAPGVADARLLTNPARSAGNHAPSRRPT